MVLVVVVLVVPSAWVPSVAPAVSGRVGCDGGGGGADEVGEALALALLLLAAEEGEEVEDGEPPGEHHKRLRGISKNKTW